MTLQHFQRKTLKLLKMQLVLNVKARAMGIRDARWVDAKRLPA